MSIETQFAAIEAELLSTGISESDNCIFILGSPRTGSTILYQTVVSVFQTGFISNLTNDHFAACPAIGFSVQKAANLNCKNKISSQSAFGKTKGLFQPSEGSYVMRHWYGGQQPAQTHSREIIPERKEHMIKTIKFANTVFKKPLVIKNAWNCFRIQSLATLLPNARFIWIRRDIAASAKSDLQARYIVQGDPNQWNSAMPSKIEQLQQKPYWEQVVENQFEFNHAIGQDLKKYAPNRYVEVWYEDLCKNTKLSVAHIGEQCNLISPGEEINLLDNFVVQSSAKGAELSKDDIKQINKYIDINQNKFEGFIYKNKEIELIAL